MASDTGSKCPASSPAKKDDKKVKEDECLVCLKPATDDIFECIWCEDCQHCKCTKISADQCHVLNNIVKILSSFAQYVYNNCPMFYKTMTVRFMSIQSWKASFLRYNLLVTNSQRQSRKLSQSFVTIESR